MLVIECDNVCDALPQGVGLLQQLGRVEASRNGDVLVAPEPVATVYRYPTQRVLFTAIRDANPFFHLIEAMWMLAGRRDATYLDTYVKTFSRRFAEDDGNQHGAYGFRWRSWFGDDLEPLDQLDMIAAELRANPQSRRAVLTMFDPPADLGQDKRDIPCNTQAYFRVREGNLDITVNCRSNDIIWGCYGANAVHFSFLLEYMAAKIGAKVGTYTQVSNNFHAYLGVLEPMLERCIERAGRRTACPWPQLSDNRYEAVEGHWSLGPLVTHPEVFDLELAELLGWSLDELLRAPKRANHFLESTVRRAMITHATYRSAGAERAVFDAECIEAHDWRVACSEWLTRRIK